MGKKRRSYSREFKLEAVSLIIDGGLSISQAARDLDISEGVLRRWKNEYDKDSEDSFPGKGNLSAQDAEIHRLKRELGIAREERDILKKALGVFSRMPK